MNKDDFGIIVMEHARPECLRLTKWSLEQCPELAGLPRWFSVCEPLASCWPHGDDGWDIVRWNKPLTSVAHHMAATSFALLRCKRVLVLDGDVLVRPTALATALAFPDDVPFCSLWRQGAGLEQVCDYTTMSNVVSGKWYGELLMFLMAEEFVGMEYSYLGATYVIKNDETGHDTLYAAWMHKNGYMSRHASKDQVCHFGFKGFNNRRCDLYERVFSLPTYEEQAAMVLRIYAEITDREYRARNGLAPMDFVP